MAHPFADHRQSKVEHDRVGKITKGYASGGAVTSPAATAKPAGASKAGASMPVEGRKNGGRLDRYARGGKVKAKGATNVTVVVAPQAGGDKPEMPPPQMPAAAPPAPPPRPPMMPPPGMGGPPGMPPGAGGGLPGMRKDGGRTGFAKGGAVKSGATWKEGIANGTPVEHSPGKNDGDKISAKPPLLTRKRGGRTYPLTAGSESGVGRLQKAKAQRKSYP